MHNDHYSDAQENSLEDGAGALVSFHAHLITHQDIPQNIKQDAFLALGKAASKGFLQSTQRGITCQGVSAGSGQAVLSNLKQKSPE